MNCMDIEPLILLQDSGEISDIQQQKLIMHLENCAACRKLSADLGLLRKTIRDGSNIHTGPLPSTLAHIREAATGHHTPKMWIFTHPWPVAFAVAASLLFCLTTLRFVVAPPALAPTIAAQASHATEIIPLIAMITGMEPRQLPLEGDDTELTILANELLRLQGMAVEGSDEKTDSTTQPEDYQPTTLLWNNIPGSPSGRYG